jgi:hypothetical protein
MMTTVSVMVSGLELRNARDDVMNRSLQLINLGLCRGDAVVDFGAGILTRG